jgi:hypothetical protein
MMLLKRIYRSIVFISASTPLLRKRTDCWYAFSWSICDKNCHFIRCIESDCFQGYVGKHESRGDKKTTSAKRNSGRKSTLTERDNRTMRKIILKNHRNIAAQATRKQN